MEGHEAQEGQEGQEGHVHKLEFLRLIPCWRKVGVDTFVDEHQESLDKLLIVRRNSFPIAAHRPLNRDPKMEQSSKRINILVRLEHSVYQELQTFQSLGYVPQDLPQWVKGQTRRYTFTGLIWGRPCQVP